MKTAQYWNSDSFAIFFIPFSQIRGSSKSIFSHHWSCMICPFLVYWSYTQQGQAPFCARLNVVGSSTQKMMRMLISFLIFPDCRGCNDQGLQLIRQKGISHIFVIVTRFSINRCCTTEVGEKQYWITEQIAQRRKRSMSTRIAWCKKHFSIDNHNVQWPTCRGVTLVNTNLVFLRPQVF